MIIVALTVVVLAVAMVEGGNVSKIVVADAEIVVRAELPLLLELVSNR